MPFTDVPGARIYWKRDGRDDAPALVLLNSIGTDMDLWDGVLPFLREDFALLRIDTRGHGASCAEPGDMSLAMLADDVLAVADTAGLGRFAVAGVSLGGMTAMELALRAPKRISDLALICTSAAMDAASWNDRIAKVRTEGMAAIADLAMGRFLSDAAAPAIWQSVRRQLLAMEAEGYAGCGAAIRDMDLARRIAGIACPTLVITGTRDTSTPLAGHGEHLLAHIPNAAHRSLDTAHLAPLEAPEALAGALLSFLQVQTHG
ncbi:3-oxoadipate enol-lactonase/4-carboxymuconolactone decarboxylase [Novosphingobium sp. SG751A]|uniref:alpha/beta fold hydrolase n=1 Tax=Novosphingobium sp. SG751A TaxID=2587000 RepID=UPI001551BB34|nr:alpha/beta fold hydrolase [Novosphingobium sp. SG751A]NOW45188.1 3-oxoadipate enol-lactonase/4-carboxymuconolactone decarboxylase [Novosphingobium sp. SG751A]